MSLIEQYPLLIISADVDGKHWHETMPISNEDMFDPLSILEYVSFFEESLEKKIGKPCKAKYVIKEVGND